LRVRLVDRSSRQPLAGVPVRVELRGGGRPAVELARFTTDAHGVGQPRFQVPDAPDGTYPLCVVAGTRGGPQGLSPGVRLPPPWKLMLTSDKPVYQPGQTIRVRALALRRPDLKPVAGRPATFTLADPKGNVLFKQQGPTSPFGIVAMDCPLDREILEGTYVIGCTVGDTESRLAVEVKKYVLPRFKVDVRLDRPFYEPGATARPPLHRAGREGPLSGEGRLPLRQAGRRRGLRGGGGRHGRGPARPRRPQGAHGRPRVGHGGVQGPGQPAGPAPGRR